MATMIPPVLNVDELSQEERATLEWFRELFNTHGGFEQLDEFFYVDGPDCLARIMQQGDPKTTREHIFWQHHSMLEALFPHISQVAVADDSEDTHWRVFALDHILLRYEAVRRDNDEWDEFDFSGSALRSVKRHDLVSMEITVSSVYR